MNGPNPQVAPGGVQHRISRADQVVTVTELGATLREYTVGGRAVLDGFQTDEMCDAGRGQVLMPWPNRIAGGKYRFGPGSMQLPLTEPARGHAIHGLVRWVPWRLVQAEKDAVEFAFTLHPQPGYPFTLDLAMIYALTDDGLRVTATAINHSPLAAPFGFGAHPYLKPIAAGLAGAMLTIPAQSYLEVDDRMIPTGRKLAVRGTPLDFQAPRAIGATVLDTCFCDFDRAAITLDDLELWWDGELAFAQCFSGDTLPPGRRRQGLAVEPMSCPADAFNSGEGLVLLPPGQRWSGTWGIALSGAAGGQPRQ